MPRPIWSGAVSFGLVTVPIKLEPATESHAVDFRQIHSKDGGRIWYRKVCGIDGKELRQDEIGKGFEYGDEIIPITDEDLATMPLPTAKAIDIVAFVPWDSIDRRHIGEASYYLSADGQVAAKPYTLLRQALGRNEKVAGIALMEALSVDRLDDVELVDHYRDALVEVIEAKAEQREVRPVEGEEEAPSGRVVDLMAALQESVAKAKESRGETAGGDATVHEMPKSKKQAAAKKTPAKKTAVKMTTAKKTARKRAS
ncbi:Ku protein [Streptomyces sp. NPDC015346]|uniref:Ku protein n=1 Tax=Streptomyces sp. NPDC015346 TaxID=3364954 RepID=UPI003700CC08